MKKRFACALLALALSLAMSTAALAADGIQSANSTVGENVTLAVNQNNPDKLDVTYPGAASGSQYVVFATSGSASELPTESNLVYIDQKAAGASGVSFTVYPKTLTNGTYQVWMSSSADSGVGSRKAVNIGNFEYHTEKPAHKLGDVNTDEKVDSVDALFVLRGYAGTLALTDAQKLAADVDGNSSVTSVDALYILRFFANDITKFPAEQ